MLLENITKQKVVYIIMFHLLLGVLFNLSSLFLDLWYYGCALWAISNLISKQNRNEIAASASFYFVGLEVVSRMVHGNVPWEGVKYIVILFLFLGNSLFNKKSENNQGIIIYFLLLIPSIFIVDYPNFEAFKSQISFNISGPLCLLVTTIYFSGRTYSVNQLKSMMLLCILPILATCMVIFLRIPSFSELKFQDAANFQLSGGFGPNQVASIMGFGLIIMFFSFFLAISLTGLRWLDLTISIALFIFCTINFSRGGIFTAIISTFLGALVWNRYSASQKKGTLFLGLSVVILSIVILFNYIDLFTGNTLSQRYAGSTSKKDARYEQFGSGVSGRDVLILSDLDIFKNNPVMGIGMGMTYYQHANYMDRNIASHTEITRLLSEHGSMGLAALILLLSNPIRSFRRTPHFYKRLFLVMFTSYALICTTHAAMRLAMMGFGYGIAFMNIIPRRRDERDPVTDYQAQSLIWNQYEEGILTS